MKIAQLIVIDLAVAYIILCTLVKVDDPLAGPLGLFLLLAAIVYTIMAIKDVKRDHYWKTEFKRRNKVEKSQVI